MLSLGAITWGILVFCALIVVLSVIFGMYYRKTAGMASIGKEVTMKGKTVIITGASAGIGKEAAREMARRGARVIMGCRNLTKAQKVADDIQSTSGNPNVLVRQLDTSVLSSVRSFAAKILAEEKQIDVLVLNAGIAGLDERRLTSDGFEMTMATNHFGHFLLTNILLGRIKDSAPSRIVVTASDSHLNTVDVNNLNFEKGDFGPYKSYCQSKSCNILMSVRLSQLTRGTGVIVNSFNPGLVYTEIFNKAGGFLIGKFFWLLTPLLGKTEVQGAQTTIYLSAADETKHVTGKFFEDCKESSTAEVLMKEDGLARKVWEVSETLVSLQASERHY